MINDHFGYVVPMVTRIWLCVESCDGGCKLRRSTVVRTSFNQWGAIKPHYGLYKVSLNGISTFA